ncbi:Golgi-specific brefeldin A-resistance guanine nucleotide exchange factor 1-like isoform X2 [Amphiura filiformis]|uniref:Golgi-specific brefeldin A-resistance guanine nucleotide exchange factor 1-like isoform X2 n=1 Tax=Amphiura filiformis TaxID=82378 RepID=UPI003B20DF17
MSTDSPENKMSSFTRIEPPKIGVYIVQGEMLLVVTAMRRSSRWTSHLPQDEDQDPLLNNFGHLKDTLNSISDLNEIEPNTFLSPFLDVIRSEDTTGPITGLALSSVNKFLSYGLLDTLGEGTPSGIENIADAVTHARFVGTDPGSDEVVLMKILQVLRTLLLTPVGMHLSNESVCEIMQSCFRICFEMRLSELLRRTAEHTLVDMVQLLFSRVPHFSEEKIPGMKKLKMRAGGIPDSSRRRRSRPSPKTRSKKDRSATATSEETPTVHSAASSATNSATPSPTPVSGMVQGPTALLSGTASSATGPIAESSEPSEVSAPTEPSALSEGEVPSAEDQAVSQPASPDSGIDAKEGVMEVEGPPQTKEHVISMQGEQRLDDGLDGKKEDGDQVELERCESMPEGLEDLESIAEQSDSASVPDSSEYINPQGVRFTPQQRLKDGMGPVVPYGLPCVRELLRFLISLINPYDRHNTDLMMHMGLSLLTVALETGSEHISHFSALLSLVKDEMCKNLFALLQSDKLSLFAASLRVCFMLFESMRTHLKFQLEMYLHRLTEIIVSESPRIPYEQREMAIDSIVQLWRIPSLVTELYLNYDCDIYCSNLFEDLTKLLSKNAFPVSGSLYTTHLLSLDALLAVVDSIEANCHHRILSNMAEKAERDRDQRVNGSDTSSGITIHVEDVSKEVVADEKVSSKDEGEEDGALDGEEEVGMQATPPTTGYAMAQMLSGTSIETLDNLAKLKYNGKIEGSPSRRTSRFPPSPNLPTTEDLIKIKTRKKIILAGSEQFNQKPSKGIAFLQEQGILKAPLDPDQVGGFLRENPRLDKKQIGEYISAKKNAKVLEAFLRTFVFEGARIDEALRMYLETFRLPGEAPVIQHLMEHFSEHWHITNKEPFANHDAAFTLAYAVIMLNVDQHNQNAKKQNIPMTVDNFKKNVSKVNGGQDFEPDMLGEIFNAIKNEEIVMPAEQTGLVRENYLWRVLLKRCNSSEGAFIHAPCGTLDKDLFLLCWGPTVAALSFVFDKSMDETITQKVISGFRKCAMISAHYGLGDVFDNLVISLCKFTTLLSSSEAPENLPVVFGSNSKAQLAAKTVFGLAHRHGDILGEGWKNLLDCMLQLYRAKLLPSEMVEVQDFVDPSGRVSLVREEMPLVKSDSSLLVSFYSYFTTETSTQKGPTIEDQEAMQEARSCIEDCHPEHLITESKFLRLESLQELMKALTFASQGPQQAESLGTPFEEEAAVFNFELLLRVVLENRDRVGSVWQGIRDHLYSLIVAPEDPSLLVERAVVGILRLAIRLLRREDVAIQVLSSLRMLLFMKKPVAQKVCRQVAFGLHELLRTNAANIHSTQDWYTLFMLLECVGAGAITPAAAAAVVEEGFQQENGYAETGTESGAQSDSEISMSSEGTGRLSEQGYISDSELDRLHKQQRSGSESDVSATSVNSTGWLMVKNKPGNKTHEPHNQYEIALSHTLNHHDTKALMKSCESLAFLVRDAAHVTPANFESCVHAIRTFVEATVNGGKIRQDRKNRREAQLHREQQHRHRGSRKRDKKLTNSKSVPDKMQLMGGEGDEEEASEGGPPGGYHSLSIQLLDLMHTLHTRAASIFSSWAEEEVRDGHPSTIDAGASALWLKCWCPLLQGIARLCCDIRRQVRMQALTYLQRALLVHDLQTLSAIEWESCFNKVLFPLLSKLLENVNLQDPVGMEETRMRAATLLSKVFLQHLTPLLSLSTFTALWLTILDFMDKYMHADKSDLLFEAIPESLKNMLLVMDTAGVFQTDVSDGGKPAQLWLITWERIDCFLPGLKDEVFKPREPVKRKVVPETGDAPKQDSIPRDGASPQPTPKTDEQPSEGAEPTAKPETGKDSPRSSKPNSRPGTPQNEPVPSAAAAPKGPSEEKKPEVPPLYTPDKETVNIGQSNIILQPPLPNLPTLTAARADVQHGSVPFLLNPAIMGTPVPILALSKESTSGPS